MPRRVVRFLRNAEPHVFPALAVVAFIATGIVLIFVIGLVRKAEQIRQVQCTLRADYDNRIAFTQALLSANPKADTIGGFDRATIILSLENTRRTRQAMDSLDCHGVKVDPPQLPKIPTTTQ
jgi:hypothetical protein